MEEVKASLTLLADRLSRSEIFNALSDDNLLEIAKFCQEETYQDGQVVFVEGEPANKMLVVERGKLAIEKKGVQILESTVKDGRIDLDVLIENLGGLGITSLLIEGGSRVIAASLGASVVDKVIFFFAPRILGGDDGVPICSGAGPELMSESIPLRDINVRRFGDDVMIEGYIATCSQEL